MQILDSVEEFILQFKSAFADKMDIEWGFLNGNCYWFAHILKGRFPNGVICFVPDESHFVFLYDWGSEVRVYDIKGRCNPKSMIDWYQYQAQEPARAERIMHDCIYKYID